MQACALWAIALVKLLISALEDNLLVDTKPVTLPQNKQIKKTAVWQKKLDPSAESQGDTLRERYTQKGKRKEG
ncbi:hypothetical protein SD80_029080 [Scytonema tolypothrichoides VB-61278]|nr:hypothetical protein SD80_029080 [Scytonema tolypothrichoides VB-61278]